MEEKQILYLGESGKTHQCLIAISTIINSGYLPESATVVTFEVQHGKTSVEHHLFLFWNWEASPLTIVPAGFTSGYSGGGSRAFSLALCMIENKQVPMYEYYTTNGDTFADINENKIQNMSAPIYQEIKNKSRKLTYIRSGWVTPEHKEMLQRGQIWRAFYWYSGHKCDWITEAIGDVDLYHPAVGRKLRIAEGKLKDAEYVEEWQSAGILLRDAWIELLQKVCQDEGLDLSGIGQDQVSDMLGKLQLNEKTKKFIKSIFDFNLHVQHNRKIDRHITRASFASTALTMQMLVHKALIEKGSSIDNLADNLLYGKELEEA